MTGENTQCELGNSGDAAAPEPLRGRLERFGDPHVIREWETGEVDYVAALGLTAADVPELLAVARQWAEEFEWPDDKSDVSIYAPVHAWRGLAQLRATEAIGPLLEMMEPLDKLGDNWAMSELPNVFAMIGPASLDPLRETLADVRHGTYARAAAAEGLTELTKRHGELRGDVVKALSAVMAGFEGADPRLLGLVLANLLDLKAVEAAEVIERAHAADAIDISMCGNWETVRKELGVDGLGLVPKDVATRHPLGFSPEMQEMLAYLRERIDSGQISLADLLSDGLLGDGPPDDDLPDDDLLDDGPPDGPDRLARPRGIDASSPAAPAAPRQSARKVGRNDPCPCGSGKKYKKCCLR
jgi:hypothetical protein